MKLDAIIASIGARAARLLGEHATWTVEAVFDRSLYIRSADEFICIGDASIGDGPLNAALIFGSTLPVREIGTRVSVDISTAQVRRCPPWSFTSTHIGADNLRDIIGHALHEAPRDSFMHAMFSTAASAARFARRARSGAQALRDGLQSGNPAKFDEAASLLLGLGHGLTPSGDDVLSGALVALHALGEDATAAALCRSVFAKMISATSALSCAFLRAACDGEPSAAMHRSIAALLTGCTATNVVAPVRLVGHCSGFDMLAGAILVAQIHHERTTLPRDKSELVSSQ